MFPVWIPQKIYYLKEFYTVINENFPVLHSPMPEQGDDFGVMTGAERMLELAEQVIGLKDDSPMIRQMKMEMRYIKGRYEIAMGEYDRGNSDINCSMALALGQHGLRHVVLSLLHIAEPL